MNYLVTGAAGFIGSKITESLIKQGHKVTTIDNLSTGYESNIPNLCKFIKGDISNYTIAKLRNEKFDAILHIAGQSSGELSFEDPVNDLSSNTTSTLLLLNFAIENKCKRFIYASTMSIYGESEGKEKFSELDTPHPKSLYAVGKLASENYLEIFNEHYEIIYTSLRYFNVYGPGQNLENLKQGMVSIYLKQFIDSNFPVVEVKGSLDRFRDLSYIDDVVDVTIESIHNKGFFNLVVNIGSGKKTKVKKVIELMHGYLGSNKNIKLSNGTPGDQFGIYANNSRLKSICNIEFRPFSEGLKNMLEELNILKIK